MTLRIDLVQTRGVFSLDGEDFDVENNIWLVGDDREVVVIDAAHNHEPIVEAVGGRVVRMLICTHGHNDHINAAGAFADETDTPIALHGADRMLWDMIYADRAPDRDLAARRFINIAGTDMIVIHTPGHSPGGVCLHIPRERVLFSGDTLFEGGPGATGRSHSDYPTILESVRTKLLVLPPDTVVHTGHGPSTTIGAEAPGIAAA